MHNKFKNIKHILLGACCTALVLSQPITSFALPQSNNLTASTTSAGESRAAIIEWVYKRENGHLYKRLYDYTYQQWIGDWIFVS